MTYRHSLSRLLLTALLLTTLLLTTLLAACEQDNYDKGQGLYSLMQADFVEAHSDAAKALDYVLTDEGDRLALTPVYTAKWVEKADTLYRAVLYYNKVDAGAEPISVSRVATAQPRQRSSFKEGLKTDPVGLESAWVSRSGKYLNLSLILKVGSTDDESAVHRLAIVSDTIMVHPGDRSACHLSLYHDQGAVPEYYSQRSYVSIPLADISADTLVLRLNTYEGELVKRFVLR